MAANRLSARETILQAELFCDPHKQGEGWPDPIAWDGRPLRQQASDLIPVIEGYLCGHHPEYIENRAIRLISSLKRIARIR